MWAGILAALRGLRHLNNRGYIYVWANVVWALLTLLVVTAPAAWAGLALMSHRLHRQPIAGLDDFWQGFRENLKRTLPLAILNLLLVVMTFSNLIAYAGQDGIGVIILRWVWVLSLVVAFAVQYFAWCFYYAMEQPTFIGALKNAAVMMLSYPFFSIGVLLVVFIIMSISTVLGAGWLLIGGSALAAIATSAVQDRLRVAGIEAAPTFDESAVVDVAVTDI
jgi:hypothetical protein